MIISLKAEKGFEKTQHTFMTKFLKGSVIQAACINIVKGIYSNTIANIKINGEKLKAKQFH